MMIVYIPKLNPGEYFENLDMLTTLLQSKKPKMIPNIEILGGNYKKIYIFFKS